MRYRLNAIALYKKFISELRSVTRRMGSHSITCHPTQVNAPRLNPSQIGWYSIYLPRKDGRLSWPRRLVTYRNTRRHSTVQVLSRPEAWICHNALPLRHATNRVREILMFFINFLKFSKFGGSLYNNVFILLLGAVAFHALTVTMPPMQWNVWWRHDLVLKEWMKFRPKNNGNIIRE